MNKARLQFLAVLALGFFLVGCSQEARVTEEEAATEAAAVTQVDPATAGTITGKASFEGTAPRMRRIAMGAVPECEELHKGKVVVSDQVVLNDNGTLSNVFVYIKGGLEGKTFAKPEGAVHLDQKGCLYTPHVIGVQAGQEIQIHTSDPTTHNIHPMPEKNREWNTSMAPGARPLKRIFSRPEVMIPIKCNVHPWMRAYVGVVSHPFFAVTGADGSFEISGIPPGDYVVEAWHERFGTTEQNVTVGEKETQTADFSFQS